MELTSLAFIWKKRKLWSSFYESLSTFIGFRPNFANKNYGYTNEREWRTGSLQNWKLSGKAEFRLTISFLKLFLW